MKFVIDRQYAIAPKTKTVIISRNRYISFTLTSKYLGSLISYDLDDTFDVTSWIKNANQAMNALNIFVIRKDRPSLQIINIYIADPLNLYLWGCEYWALVKALLIN